jgi:hypothetical protein
MAACTAVYEYGTVFFITITAIDFGCIVIFTIINMRKYKKEPISKNDWKNKTQLQDDGRGF